MTDSLDPLVVPRNHLGPIEVPRQSPVQDVRDQRGLARPGDTGHRHEQPERHLDVEVLEVVLARAHDPQRAFRARRPPRGRHGDAQLAAQVASRERRLVGQHVVHRSLGDDPPAVTPRARTEVDDVVGRPDRVGVVLHHQDRIPQVPQAPERAQQARVVAGVESHGGLIQHVEHTDQAAPDLGGEPYALRLAPGERGRRAPQGEVREPHVRQEAESLRHLLEDGSRDLRIERVAAGPDGQAVEEPEGGVHWQVHDRADPLAAHQNAQALGLEPMPAARLAGHVHHEVGELQADRVRSDLVVAALHVAQDSLPLDVVGAPGAPGRAEAEGAPRHSVEQRLPDALGEVAPGALQVESELLRERREQHVLEVALGLAPWEHDALGNRDPLVGEHQVRAHRPPHPEPAAIGAGAVGGVERELARLQLGQRVAALGAGELFREQDALPAAAVPHDLHQAVGGPQRRLDGVVQPAPVRLARHQAVHHDADVVVHPPLQLRRAGEVVHLAVHPHADEPLASRTLEQVLELALAAPHQRGNHLQLGALGPPEYDRGDLRRALPRYGRTVVGTVRHSGARPEQPDVVVDLGDGADGGAGIVAGRLLLDGDRRRQALDDVHVGLLHEPEELAGVCRERLHVAPLALGVDGVEGERRLARPRESRYHREPVAGDLDVDVLQVVDPGAADDQVLGRHSLGT